MKNVILTNEEVARIVANAQEGPNLADEIEPRAMSAWYDAERRLVMFELKNGCVFGFPPTDDAYRGLADATQAQLAQVEPDFGGEALHWEDMDADVSVPGLLFYLLNVKEWYTKWLDGTPVGAAENGKKPSSKRPRSSVRRPRQPAEHTGD